MRRQTVGIVLTALGVVGIAGSFVWKSVAEPRLVKYPTDLDETPAYSGTVKIFLDPLTYAPLNPPLEVLTPFALLPCCRGALWSGVSPRVSRRALGGGKTARQNERARDRERACG